MIDEVQASWEEHSEAKAELGTAGDLAADAGTLVGLQDSLLKPLHGLDGRELAAVHGI